MNVQRKQLRVLVTGATRFLGSHVLGALAADPRVRTVAACRHSQSLPADYAGEIRCGDLLDPDYRQALVKDIDVLCHTGA